MNRCARLRKAGWRLGLSLPSTQARRCDHPRVAHRVLIVDDDPDFLELAARIVAEFGAAVVATASDARQAAELAAASRPDAVLVDVGLPDRDGIDLANELTELPWRPRVVLTSSDKDALMAIEARDGAHRLRFVAKEELASESLRRALLDG